jgi:integrase
MDHRPDTEDVGQGRPRCRHRGADVHLGQLELVANRFARIVQAAGIPSIRFHDLRHTHASLLLAHGTPVLDVSRRIGHASAAMTLDVYGHVVPGQGQRAAAAFADLVEGGR